MRFPQLAVQTLELRYIARDDRRSDDLPVVVADRLDRDGHSDMLSILRDVSGTRNVELGGPIRIAKLGQEEVDGLADDLVRGPAVDARRAGIPRRDEPVGS